MSGNEGDSSRKRLHLNRRDVLSTATGAAVATLGIGAFSGSAAAWERFDVGFRSETEVWFVVGEIDLAFDPPLVAHVIVENDKCTECRLVEFTEDNATTYPDLFGDQPVVTYGAGEAQILGVVPYNRHYQGDDRFSRPRCLMINNHVTHDAALDASLETACVQAAKNDTWKGKVKECWFDPIEIEKAPPEDGEIDSCTAITEPGTYELTADLEPTGEDTCLEILADDVVIEGNGHTLDGSELSGDETVGILSDAVAEDHGDDEEVDGVTIRNVQVTAFDHGVRTTGDEQLDVEDAEFTDCERGVYLGTGTSGVTVSLDDVTIEDCTTRAVSSGGFNTLEITNSLIQHNAGGISTGDTTIEIEGSTIQNNDEDGLAFSDGTATLTDTMITDNGGDGIAHFLSRLTVENVTVSGNGEFQVGSTSPADPEGTPTVRLTATDFAVGESTTVDASETSLNTLDVKGEDELPALNDDMTPVAEGLEIIDSHGPELDLRFEVDSDDPTVEVWRHDDSEWEVVTEADVEDEAIEVTTEEVGLFVPVS